ncbi:MAG: glycosyltransferase, partial [Trueperaceae bacterium]|nr:glycosyltransferase [Trueperaceae bacterium]
MNSGEPPATPGVTVVTATVGRPEVLRAKATSLALQTLPRDRFEWRVAFDGVPDDLATRLEADLRAALPSDLSVAFVRTDGRGPGPARDAAAADARHAVLLLSDDDCLLD